MQLAFAAVVAGLTGEYLSTINDVPDSDPNKTRFIYTEVVAALSMLLALLWLLPFAGSFAHWLIDLILFIAWIVAFGLLVQVCPKMTLSADFTNFHLPPVHWALGLRLCLLLGRPHQSRYLSELES
jgi:hypothetical protein